MKLQYCPQSRQIKHLCKLDPGHAKYEASPVIVQHEEGLAQLKEKCMYALRKRGWTEVHLFIFYIQQHLVVAKGCWALQWRLKGPAACELGVELAT
jgi:hypothetical protein